MEHKTCRVCGETKQYILIKIYNSNTKLAKDEFGHTWSSNRCYECYKKARRKPEKLYNCQLCPVSFSSNKLGRKYCSLACRTKSERSYRKKEKVDKKCLICDKEYKSSRNDRKYCGTKCSKKAYRKGPWFKAYKKEQRRIDKRTIRQAKPKGISWKALSIIYNNVPDGYEVDHIVPLNHPIVSGLHVPWNLQYLTIKDNSIKSNSFDGSSVNLSWRKNRV